MKLRGGVKKKTHTTFGQKRYHFLFLLPFDAESFKTCKNTIKLINLCAPRLPGVNEYMRKSGTLTATGGWGLGHFVVGTTQKYHFLTPPLRITGYSLRKVITEKKNMLESFLLFMAKNNG